MRKLFKTLIILVVLVAVAGALYASFSRYIATD
jgi:hypothetical protein